VARKARSKAQKEADAEHGKRIARLRRQRGFTQVELAKALGTIQSVVSEYERGRLRPNPTMLAKLAMVLHVSGDEILGIASSSSGAAPLSRRFLRRLKAVEDLPKRDQEALLRTIDAFLSARKAS
jgi:transcriptional regulator with XRE-family HTH domain